MQYFCTFLVETEKDEVGKIFNDIRNAYDTISKASYRLQEMRVIKVKETASETKVRDEENLYEPQIVIDENEIRNMFKNINEAEEMMLRGYSKLRDLGVIQFKKAAPEENGQKEN